MIIKIKINDNDQFSSIVIEVIEAVLFTFLKKIDFYTKIKTQASQYA